MSFILPQNDSNAKRSGELDSVRKEYAYDHKYGFPLVVKYQKRNMNSSKDWYLGVFNSLREIRSNVEAILEKPAGNRPIRFRL